ncbi:MAG: acylneuraminate cytidylyltransferase [Microbacteriaceae bacterium]|nr:acylneuraminate cytidylyltransferase [Microbacteriaceae bacterium]
MSVIAIIPARGGSKGVPGKNLRRVGGVPLVVRAIEAARSIDCIDQVIVSTDDPTIAATATAAGAIVVGRPARIAGDEASSESAILDALGQLDVLPELVVFLQATSPFIDRIALSSAIGRVQRGEQDVVFSAIETYGFLWRDTDEGAAGVNHDASVRPRRQDREPHYLETGAFYVMRADGFIEAEHRFFGQVDLEPVDPRTAIEIDTLDELEVARALAPLLDITPGNLLEIAAVVTDFDGVHTDDRVLVGADGSEFITASRSDGMGVRHLREAGYPVLILSTEANPVVGARAAKLGTEVLQGVGDKATALAGWASERGIPLDRVAYLGNDGNDLGCMQLVGWPVAVPGSAPEIRQAARIVLETPGGYGAVRELADMILRPDGRRNDRQWEESWPYQSVAQQ